jgi:hypothetical protein
VIEIGPGKGPTSDRLIRATGRAMDDLEEFEKDTVFILLRWLVVSMIFAPLLISFSVPATAAIKLCVIALAWELLTKKKYCG